MRPPDTDNVSPDGAHTERESMPSFYRRRQKRDNELGQVLLRLGAITPEQLREALAFQAEHGGHIGAILRALGACDSRAIANALIEQLRTARAKGRDSSLVRAARENPSILGLRVPCRPRLVVALLFLSDLLSLTCAAALMWWVVSGDVLSLTQRVVIASLVPLCLLVMASVHLYEVTPPSPPEEIRRATMVITITFFGAWMVSLAARIVSAKTLSHGGWFLAWALAVMMVPIMRGVLRTVCAKKPWWGHACVVIGAGRLGRAVVQTLQRRPQLGLKPVVILDDDSRRHGSVRVAWGEDDMVVEPVSSAFHEDVDTPSERSAIEQFAMVEGVPVVGGIDLAAVIAQRLDINAVVVAMPEMDSQGVLGLIERFGDSYTKVLVIPDLFNLTHFGAATRPLGGAIGLEVQRQLMHKGPRIAKRTMDVVLTLIGGLMIMPLLLSIALVIAIDSRGGVFYRQRRLGQDGVRFMALKFRTMRVDADARLAALLESDSNLRAEYTMFHKLAEDPRVTRAGKFLRKYSLDELPQIWNVLQGEMSLVGPRPYLEREIPDMEQKEAIVLRVKPGVTGIWQVTTRNESTFQERVDLDVEYVRNWSPWLDLYILARTVPVVVGGTGS